MDRRDSSRGEASFPTWSRRTGLKVGTALGGVMAAGLFLAPGAVLAQDACGVPVNGEVICAGSGAPYADGVRYEETGATPQDLTIVLEPEVAIETAADGVAGVSATNSSGGSVTISGAGVGITTSGAGAQGVAASATGGGIAITVGDVTTNGYRADGVFASTNFGPDGGDIDISAGVVNTFGEASTGIRAETSEGDIRIGAAGVYAWAYGSDGIYAAANEGDTTVEVGNVVTFGDGGRGVTVYSEGATVISAEGVFTYGEGLHADFDAGAIKAVGTSVAVDVGTVVTRGDLSTGIHASSNLVVFDETIVNPDITVTAGLVRTSGTQSHGIVATNFAEGGATSVTAQTVVTAGDQSFGVYAAAFDDVAVTLGSVTTSGYGSTAVGGLSVEGDLTVAVDSVRTSGAVSRGIDLINYSAGTLTSVAAGEIVTRRDYSAAAVIFSEGDIALTAQTVSTNGFNSQGVSAVSYSGDIKIDLGSVSTTGDLSNAVDLAGAGDFDVSVGTIRTQGANSSGIYVGSFDVGTVTVEAGEIVTSGAQSLGIGVVTTNYGAVDITATTIRTSGDGSTGVLARTAGGDITLDIGSIVTTGGTVGPQTSTGLSIDAFEGDVIGRIGSVSTAGANSGAISSNVAIGSEHLMVSGAVSTTGNRSDAIFAAGTIADIILDLAGPVTTTGDQSNAISGFLTMGDFTLNASGAITTSGAEAVGIDVTALSFGRPPYTYYGETEPDIRDATVHIKANAITTTGAGADGVRVTTGHQDLYGDAPVLTNAISIATGAVQVSGEDAVGIRVNALRGAEIDAGATRSTASNAILVQAGTDVALNIRGATVAEATDAVVLTGKDLAVSIEKTGGVQGATSALVLTATGKDLVNAAGVSAPFGQIDLVNAGSILGGSDHAITVFEGQLDLTNTGVIRGGLSLADGNDRIANDGVFVADRDSDFGAGDDLFLNTGSVVFDTAASARAVRLDGLERFDNQGLVDLRNGVAGDVLTLSGDYVGSGEALVGLDVDASSNDRLVVGGAATGQTGLLLQNLTPGGAALTGAAAHTLVQVGEGSAADAFHIANPDIGLIHYGLVYDAASASYVLAGEAGAPVYRSLGYGQAAQDAWTASADAWSAELASLRTGRWAGAGTGGRVWAQAFGSDVGRDGAATLGGETVRLDVDQSQYGGQMGIEVAHRDAAGANLALGLTGGYVQSDLTFAGSRHKADVETLSLGAYLAASRGLLFANALAGYARHGVDVDAPEAGYAASIDGSTLGVRLEAGARFGSDRVSIEPVAGLDWTTTRLDDLAVLNQTVRLDDLDGLIGRIGARASVRRPLASGVLVLTGGLAAAHAFSGDAGAVLSSGGVEQSVEEDRTGAFGQATLGVTWASSQGLSLFVEGRGDFGDARSGGGARLGARFRF